MNDKPSTPAQPVFSEVLSRAVQARGLSLDRIRARLEAAGVPVSNATLSYWQSGRSLPTRARSLRTLVELESILQLEPGSLIELIRTADGRTRHQLFAWQTVVPSGELAEHIIADMGMEVSGRISRVTVHDTLTLDAIHKYCRVVDDMHPLYFDELYRNLVKAGESAGVLDTVLDTVASYKENIEALKGKIKKALFYPAALTHGW